MKFDKEEAYVVTCGNAKYHIYLRTMYKMDDSIMSVGFRLAGEKRGCVSMTLLCSNGTLTLNNLDYHEKCIMGGPDMRMARGDMLRLALAFMVDQYGPTQVKRTDVQVERPFAPIQRIVLSDASHVPCKTLMNSYIAVYGKTWYESKFGAETCGWMQSTALP